MCSPLCFKEANRCFFTATSIARENAQFQMHLEIFGYQTHLAAEKMKINFLADILNSKK